MSESGKSFPLGERVLENLSKLGAVLIKCKKQTLLWFLLIFEVPNIELKESKTAKSSTSIFCMKVY